MSKGPIVEEQGLGRTVIIPPHHHGRRFYRHAVLLAEYDITAAFMSRLRNGDPVHVKSYWETVSDLFAACCCCCLGSRNKTEYERLLDEQEEQVEQAVRQSPPLLRWIALLSTGYYLPDNAQLYALLFRLAGWIDGIRLAKGPPESGEPGGEPLLGEACSRILDESQQLCKNIAKWIASRDAVIGHTEGETSSEKRAVPNGNSRNQIQRLVFHLTRMMRKGDVVAVDKDVLIDSVPGMSNIKEAASETAEDLRLTVASFVHLFVAFATSRQLTDLIRDAINSARDAVADAVDTVVDGATRVEDAVRPDDRQRQGHLKDELNDIAASSRATVSGAASIDPAAATSALLQVPESAADAAKRKTPSRQEVVDRAARIIADLVDNDDSFRSAMQQLVSITEKYRRAARAAAKGNFEELPGAQANETPRSGPAFDWNSDIAEVLKAAGELLEGMAGGKSLSPILADVEDLWTAVQSDVFKAIDDWLEKAHRTISEVDRTSEIANKTQDDLRALAVALQDIFANRPDLHDRVRQILRNVSAFLAEIGREPRMSGIIGRIKAIARELRDAAVFSTHALVQSFTTDQKSLLSDLTSHVLPAVLQSLGEIPIPRLEYHSPEVDVALDDVHIAAINLLPARIKVQLTEAFEWNRISRQQYDARLKQARVEMSGVRLAVKDVSFFVREKVTQISSHWLNTICCALPSRRHARTLAGELEEGHLAAFREQALLDAGLFGKAGSDEGGSVVLDLSQISAAQSSHRNNDKDVSRLFEVRQSTLDLSDSFDIRLRKSHHSVLNALVTNSLGAPLARMALERLGAGFIKHGVETLADKAADFHHRAQFNAQHARASDHVLPQDYLRVALDSSAGKSRERLDREKREEEEQAERKAREERQRGEEGQETQHSRPSASVMPMAVVIQLSPDTSMSIGAYPTLLPSYAQGPATERTRTRNAIAEDRWRDLAVQRAYRTIAEVTEGVHDVAEAGRGVASAVSEGHRELREGRSLAKDLRHVAEERGEIEEARRTEQRENGEEMEEPDRWYHPGFDL